jgi:hypothetical protein
MHKSEHEHENEQAETQADIRGNAVIKAGRSCKKSGFPIFASYTTNTHEVVAEVGLEVAATVAAGLRV